MLLKSTKHLQQRKPLSSEQCRKVRLRLKERRIFSTSRYTFSQRKTRSSCVFFFQAEDGIRAIGVTGVQTCALPISLLHRGVGRFRPHIHPYLLQPERYGFSTTFSHSSNLSRNILYPFGASARRIVWVMTDRKSVV